MTINRNYKKQDKKRSANSGVACTNTQCDLLPIPIIIIDCVVVVY